MEIKEIVYQAVAYLGMGRAFPFLKVVNEMLQERVIALPLQSQAITTTENRREAGTQAQVDFIRLDSCIHWGGRRRLCYCCRLFLWQIYTILYGKGSSPTLYAPAVVDSLAQICFNEKRYLVKKISFQGRKVERK